MQIATEINEKNSVLIVDDEISNLIALTNILNMEYTVYTAKSGQEAIDAIKENPPDVILLDILMPDMDGFEVMWNLKNAEETSSIPVIFITGLSSTADEEKGLATGAVDYISKPFYSAIVKLRVENQIRLLRQINLIKALSLTDELTGLFNRRGFDSRLQLEWNRARRDQTPLGLFIFDIDNFKNYNDTYGHLQGDEALKAIAVVLGKTLKRSIDFAARWGGEEFAALLPETNLPGTINIAEKFRKNMEDTEIFCSNKEVTRITVSIGVNIFLPKQPVSVQDFLFGADSALYSAKNAGKNKVCIFENIET